MLPGWHGKKINMLAFNFLTKRKNHNRHCISNSCCNSAYHRVLSMAEQPWIFTYIMKIIVNSRRSTLCSSKFPQFLVWVGADSVRLQFWVEQFSETRANGWTKQERTSHIPKENQVTNTNFFEIIAAWSIANEQQPKPNPVLRIWTTYNNFGQNH